MLIDEPNKDLIIRRVCEISNSALDVEVVERCLNLLEVLVSVHINPFIWLLIVLGFTRDHSSYVFNANYLVFVPFSEYRTIQHDQLARDARNIANTLGLSRHQMSLFIVR